MVVGLAYGSMRASCRGRTRSAGTGMEISITEEQAHVLTVAENSAMPVLLQVGTMYPSVFVHTGEALLCLQLDVYKDLDKLREDVAVLIRAKCERWLAYALAYDSSVEFEGQTVDALIIETGDADDDQAVDFAVRYDRQAGTQSTRYPIATLRSLMAASLDPPSRHENN